MRDPSLTRAIPELLRGELLMIKCYTNRHFSLLYSARADGTHSKHGNVCTKCVSACVRTIASSLSVNFFFSGMHH